MTGVGGNGTGAGTVGNGNHNGVELRGTSAVNLNGTNNGNSVNFINCVGGAGTSGFNYGLNFNTNFTLVSGAATFRNIVGGGTTGSNQNHGVMVQASRTVNIQTIIMTDILGGPGTGTANSTAFSQWTGNVGLYVNGGTLGGSATKLISVIAGSLGLGSGEVGILVDGAGTTSFGQLVATDGGTITLNGTGGGTYNSGGS